MKYIIILSDGVADKPLAVLGNKTPLQAAHKPNIDALCSRSRTGRLLTVPLDMPPGSEIANLSVLGYDVKKVYQGRGVLEAASIGVDIHEGELGMRCNLICIEDGRIKNHSAGHITTEEAQILIEDLQKQLGNETIHLFPGVSYRHLLVLKNGSCEIHCIPPHDVPGTPFQSVLVQAKSEQGKETAETLNTLIIRSQQILEQHPVNLKRKAEGKDPANSLWFWSPGYKPQMQTFQELYGLNGAVISAVDLIYGIGKYAGLKGIHVEGSTGLWNTNYEGKAKAAVDALKDTDFVFLHIEASDEAGHEGDALLKTKTVEFLDSRVVKYIVEETQKFQEPVAIAILPDHPTPCLLRTHTHDAVPFMIFHPAFEPDSVNSFDEFTVEAGGFGLLKGDEFIRNFLKK